MARPVWTPTDAQRRQAETMAAYGIPEADIARVLGVSKPTRRGDDDAFAVRGAIPCARDHIAAARIDGIPSPAPGLEADVARAIDDFTLKGICAGIIAVIDFFWDRFLGTYHRVESENIR